MRRHAVAVAIAAAVLLYGPAVSRATARTARTTRTTTAPPAPPSPLTLTVGGAPSSPVASASLRPGSTKSLHLTATNTTSADRLDVSLSTLDATLRSDGSVVPAVGTGTTGTAGNAGAGSWLGLADTAIALVPGASVDIPLNVAVPPEATGGSVAAAVRATVTNARPIGTAPTRADIALKGMSVTVGVRIDVQAPKRAELTVAEVTVARDHGARRVRITLSNAGSTSAPVTGTLTLGR